MPTPPRPVMLVILDGLGLREDPSDNAVAQAKTPTLDGLRQTCPTATLQTSGRDVGLPDGQMGNSEVGHLNIGAGRVVMQDLPRITEAVRDGTLAGAAPLRDLIDRLKRSGGRCHLMGLVSPGGVHAHQEHAAALALILAGEGIGVDVHAFTDGRDTPPRSGEAYLAELEGELPETVRIATVCGRYFAMDRDGRWDRVSQAYRLLVDADGAHQTDAQSAIRAAYADDTTDEFVHPTVIGDYRGMRDGDGLICFNFRADRVREILDALLRPEFSGFERTRQISFAATLGMTSYSSDLDGCLGTLFAPQNLDRVLGQVVADAGKRQVRMAESEKYPHVTYFLNGGEETPYAGEDRIMVASPKVATYDLQPEMSAPELTEKAVAAIKTGTYDLIVLNFANPDMVGHTGDLAATIKAVETVDAGLGRIAEAIGQQGGALLVIADHGNCEVMRDPVTGQPHTAHTTNLVPVILMGVPGVGLRTGRLADVAPTLLHLMNVPQPAEMSGATLVTEASH